ncbi:hypothetical protein D3C76_1120680 [compost metagenome]
MHAPTRGQACFGWHPLAAIKLAFDPTAYTSRHAPGCGDSRTQQLAHHRVAGRVSARIPEPHPALFEPLTHRRPAASDGPTATIGNLEPAWRRDRAWAVGIVTPVTEAFGTQSSFVASYAPDLVRGANVGICVDTQFEGATNYSKRG